MRVQRRVWAVGLVVLAGVSCGGSQGEAAKQAAAAPVASAPTNVSMDKNSYPVFPDADAGADPAVPAEQGGKGFSGKGWETNTDFDLIGDPQAVKGGVFRDLQLEFPATLRIYGPETTILNYRLQTMLYESLLGIHPTSLTYIPGLATHWQISPDQRTFRFRLDPNARFSDGTPVTAEDVVASWKFVMDKGVQEAQIRGMMEKFEQPVAESKYVVRAKAVDRSWRNFLNFSTSLPVLPASSLKNLDGARYVKEYNFKLFPGSGPYTVRDEDVIKGKSVSIRRRKDYWAEQHRQNIGSGNFDEIRWVVIRDQKLALETFKKGELDYYYINISREWVEEFNFDKVQRGVIQKRKVYTDAPVTIQGLAFNLRRPPFDDVRVRRALSLLLNRDLLIQKLFFNEYTPMTSYFPGGAYENHDNPKNAYDPDTALKLLAEAGWSGRDSQGRLTKNGQPLSIELLYPDKGAERWLTVYQDDLRKVGIALNLRLISYETLLQLQGEWNFDLVSAGLVPGTFPDPEGVYRSTLADTKNSLNYSGIKDKRIDDILDKYHAEFDQPKRVLLIRQLDGILASLYPWILEWEAPFHRVAYLNKFGHPESYFSRIGDQSDMTAMWWIDPVRERRYQEALSNTTMKLEVGPTEVRYWQEYAKKGGAAFVPPTTR
jgi:microcin C transport system substrate-binding protein